MPRAAFQPPCLVLGQADGSLHYTWPVLVTPDGSPFLGLPTKPHKLGGLKHLTVRRPEVRNQGVSRAVLSSEV